MTFQQNTPALTEPRLDSETRAWSIITQCACFDSGVIEIMEKLKGPLIYFLELVAN